jgi:hypothetical protein
MPPDFPDMFVRLGWDAIEDHYDTGQTVVKRWMREAGEQLLIEMRRAYVRKLHAARGFRSVMGRKPGAKFGSMTEMSAGDPALAFMPVRRLRRPYGGEITMPAFFELAAASRAKVEANDFDRSCGDPWQPKQLSV